MWCERWIRTDLKEREFYFYKESWKEGTSIYFGLDKGKVYYAIKTKESLDGKAKPEIYLEHLFEEGIDAFDPYGYGYICEYDWLTNNHIWVEMADGSFAKKYIIPSVKKILEFVECDEMLKSKLEERNENVLLLVDCECVALRRSYKLLFCYRRLRAKNELFFFLGLFCSIWLWGYFFHHSYDLYIL